MSGDVFRELKRLRAKYVALASGGSGGGRSERAGVPLHERRLAAWRALSDYHDKHFPNGIADVSR
jgi:hypothetical protein